MHGLHAVSNRDTGGDEEGRFAVRAAAEGEDGVTDAGFGVGWEGGGGDAVHRRVRRIFFGRESWAFMLVGSRGLSGLRRLHVHATLI